MRVMNYLSSALLTIACLAVFQGVYCDSADDHEIAAAARLALPPSHLVFKDTTLLELFERHHHHRQRTPMEPLGMQTNDGMSRIVFQLRRPSVPVLLGNFNPASTDDDHELAKAFKSAVICDASNSAHPDTIKAVLIHLIYMIGKDFPSHIINNDIVRFDRNGYNTITFEHLVWDSNSQMTKHALFSIQTTHACDSTYPLSLKTLIQTLDAVGRICHVKNVSIASFTYGNMCHFYHFGFFDPLWSETDISMARSVPRYERI
ncbi:hypothetical protein CAC42_7865 [Sphaceloma murrayae]|uniref:Uncharacterized protein n=1 Tax=Sphaceloma murrayae TaxID=2082308 RepID=A0A2K1QXW3_9PEZI|nr:hypothetical protein CAC42_7865 [Sphaceloma murrayae]